MSQIKNFTRNFIKGCLKFILIISFIFSFLLTAIIVAVQIPAVQLYAVNKATAYLSDLLKFPVKIEGINIDWFDIVVLKGITVKDQHNASMVYLNEASVDFQVLSLMNPKVTIDEIILKNGKVNVIRYSSDNSINISLFINTIRDLSSPRKPNRPPVPFTIDAVGLENMYFSYFDQRKPFITDHFDHNHFSFDSINAKVINLRVVADTFQIDVHNLSTRQIETRLKVHEIDTKFMLTKHIIQLDELYAKIGNSKVKNYLAFHYQHIDDLSDFNSKVTIKADIDRSEVSSQDLAHFAPGMKNIPDYYSVSGIFEGKVERFNVKNVYLGFGENSVLKGKVKFDGLPDIEETFMELSFNNSIVQATDLKQYLDRGAFAVVKKFGKITGKGQFIGFLNDFVANGAVSTNLGKVVSDINLKIIDSLSPKSYYKGKLTTTNFHLGKLTDRPEIDLIDMDGTIEGKGFSLEEAEVKLDAKIKRLGFNNYNYRNIVTNAQLSEELFNGEISAADSNLTFSAKGKVDLRPGQNIFNIKAHFEKANLKPLHLSSVETMVKTDVDLNFKGLRMDDIIGDITFANTYLLYKDHKEIFLDSLHAFSTKLDGQRTFNINSDLLTLTSNGNFELSKLGRDLSQLYEEYKLAITRNNDEVQSYYQKKVKTGDAEKYKVDFEIDVIDINAILSIYTPGLYFSPGTTLSGNYSSGHTSILNLNTYIDTFYYQENAFYKTNLELSTSKITDSSNILAMLYIKSAGQKVSGFTETENFTFDGVWSNDSVLFSSSASQSKSTNSARLNGKMRLLEDKKILQFEQSYLNLLNKKWDIQGNNRIEFLTGEILVDNFLVSNGSQAVLFKGPIVSKNNKVAELTVNNFQIENLNSLLQEDFSVKGSLSGHLKIKDIFKDLDIDGQVKLSNFLIDNFLIGDVVGTSSWNGMQKQLDLNVEIERLDQKIIDLSGYLKPKQNGKKEEINLNATLTNANLDVLNPILKGVLSEISGKVTGGFQISGDFKNLLFNGKGDVKNGKFKVDYLGTTYFFEDNIYLENNLIGFKKLTLSDIEGNKAIVDGGIYHDNFRDFGVKLRGDMRNFQVLNTSEQDNDLFYGKAIVSGDVELMGPFSNLKITANAISDKGTKIFIPLNSYSEIEQQNYIRFKSFKKEQEAAKENKEFKDHLDLSGINMDFNFEITPDAYCEIIFDKKAGDIIRGNGKGNLKLKIDTRGDFYMFGNYAITKGAYNFTLAGLVNKEFSIEPNSSISWSGDPYGGILDIKAIHSQMISLAPIMDTSEARKPENQKKYPVNTILDVDGNLLSPQISLDIDIQRFGSNQGTYVAEFESKLETNEQELNRQVFSLLVLKSLARENSFSGINSGTNNLSELLSNQLSNWLSQVDENLQIDIDLNSLDKDALNTFQLRLSYTLLDGRLRITRDGTFKNVENTDQANVSNLAGEWTVEYLLSQDGKLRLKLYNRINQNYLLVGANNTTNTSAGFSVLHTQSFNSLKELFDFSKKKKDSTSHINENLQEEQEPEKEDFPENHPDSTSYRPNMDAEKREEQ